MYIDDILILTLPVFELHLRIVYNILDILEVASFFLQMAKCVFKVIKIKHLELLINEETLHFNFTKLKGI